MSKKIKNSKDEQKRRLNIILNVDKMFLITRTQKKIIINENYIIKPKRDNDNTNLVLNE